MLSRGSPPTLILMEPKKNTHFGGPSDPSLFRGGVRDFVCLFFVSSFVVVVVVVVLCLFVGYLCFFLFCWGGRSP